MSQLLQATVLLGSARLLLELRRIQPDQVRTHRGFWIVFDREFVKAGMFDIEIAALINRARELRWVSDYTVTDFPTLEEAAQAIEDAQRFIAESRTLLAKGLSP